MNDRSQSGDPCPQPGCEGFLGVYCTRLDPDSGARIRYLHCASCGYVPPDNKLVIPSRFTRRRLVRRRRPRR